VRGEEDRILEAMPWLAATVIAVAQQTEEQIQEGLSGIEPKPPR
jgi:hypothetical protein